MAGENAEVVRRLVDAFNARDPHADGAVLNDDAEWRPAYTGGGAVEGAVYRGHAGCVLLFARMRFIGRASGVEMTRPITVPSE